MPIPAVLRTPQADAGLKKGFDAMANALAVTLGPTQGIVLSQSATNGQPEILNDAATIARRILQLPHRAEDVGAMLLRNLVWRMHLRAGDGCATTAVLAQAILHQAHRAKAAGANAMLLQRGIKKAAAVAMEALRAMAQPVEGEEELISVAQSVTAEPDLSLVLGEIFDMVGPDGYVTIQLSQELSNFSGENVQLTEGLSSPVFSKRTVETRVTVRDGETVVVGGLITSRESESENKIPIIGDLPLIGPLARFNSITTSKTELLVVLTVDVLRTDEDFREMSEQQRDLFVLPDSIRQSPLMEGLRIREIGRAHV